MTILGAVLILTAVRRLGRLDLQIWQIMAAGAFVLLLTGRIAPIEAARAVNPDVMVFLFGMFIVGEALVLSGYLYHLSEGIFASARNSGRVVLLVLFVMGFFSALLMNDTVAIIGTPLMLHLAKRYDIPPKLLLLALCFSVTTGSVLSPIGNPQNLLIAVNGPVADPFITFLKYLAVPTVINIFSVYIVLRVAFRDHFRKAPPLDAKGGHLKDAGLAALSRRSLFMVFALVILKIADVSFVGGFDFRLTWIAVLSAVPIVLLSPRRVEILKKIDWHTLVFFASLFILMEGVWMSGAVQAFVSRSGLDQSSSGGIIAISVVLSQIFSNVPFVALFLPVLSGNGVGTAGMMALASGSTIAGNLLILGAASNVIIIQNAEKRGETITFMEFAKAGVPLTAINVGVYSLFLWLFS